MVTSLSVHLICFEAVDHELIFALVIFSPNQIMYFFCYIYIMFDFNVQIIYILNFCQILIWWVSLKLRKHNSYEGIVLKL